MVSNMNTNIEENKASDISSVCEPTEVLPSINPVNDIKGQETNSVPQNYCPKVKESELCHTNKETKRPNIKELAINKDSDLFSTKGIVLPPDPEVVNLQIESNSYNNSHISFVKVKLDIEKIVTSVLDNQEIDPITTEPSDLLSIIGALEFKHENFSDRDKEITQSEKSKLTIEEENLLKRLKLRQEIESVKMKEKKNFLLKHELKPIEMKTDSLVIEKTSSVSNLRLKKSESKSLIGQEERKKDILLKSCVVLLERLKIPEEQRYVQFDFLDIDTNLLRVVREEYENPPKSLKKDISIVKKKLCRIKCKKSATSNSIRSAKKSKRKEKTIDNNYNPNIEETENIQDTRKRGRGRPKKNRSLKNESLIAKIDTNLLRVVREEYESPPKSLKKDIFIVKKKLCRIKCKKSPTSNSIRSAKKSKRKEKTIDNNYNPNIEETENIQDTRKRGRGRPKKNRSLKNESLIAKDTKNIQNNKKISGRPRKNRKTETVKSKSKPIKSELKVQSRERGTRKSKHETNLNLKEAESQESKKVSKIKLRDKSSIIPRTVLLNSVKFDKKQTSREKDSQTDKQNQSQTCQETLPLDLKKVEIKNKRPGKRKIEDSPREEVKRRKKELLQVKKLKTLVEEDSDNQEENWERCSEDGDPTYTPDEQEIPETNLKIQGKANDRAYLPESKSDLQKEPTVDYLMTKIANPRYCYPCNSFVSDGTSLHWLPEFHVLRRQKWLEYCATVPTCPKISNLTDYMSQHFKRNVKLCSKHFKKDMYMYLDKNKLYPFAVPSVEIPESSQSEIPSSKTIKNLIRKPSSKKIKTRSDTKAIKNVLDLTNNDDTNDNNCIAVEEVVDLTDYDHTIDNNYIAVKKLVDLTDNDDTYSYRRESRTSYLMKKLTLPLPHNDSSKTSMNHVPFTPNILKKKPVHDAPHAITVALSGPYCCVCKQKGSKLLDFPEEGELRQFWIHQVLELTGLCYGSYERYRDILRYFKFPDQLQVCYEHNQMFSKKYKNYLMRSESMYRNVVLHDHLYFNDPSDSVNKDSLQTNHQTEQCFDEIVEVKHFPRPTVNKMKIKKVSNTQTSPNVTFKRSVLKKVFPLLHPQFLNLKGHLYSSSSSVGVNKEGLETNIKINSSSTKETNKASPIKTVNKLVTTDKQPLSSLATPYNNSTDKNQQTKISGGRENLFEINMLFPIKKVNNFDGSGPVLDIRGAPQIILTPVSLEPNALQNAGNKNGVSGGSNIKDDDNLQPKGSNSTVDVPDFQISKGPYRKDNTNQRSFDQSKHFWRDKYRQDIKEHNENYIKSVSEAASKKVQILSIANNLDKGSALEEIDYQFEERLSDYEDMENQSEERLSDYENTESIFEVGNENFENNEEIKSTEKHTNLTGHTKQETQSKTSEVYNRVLEVDNDDRVEICPEGAKFENYLPGNQSESEIPFEIFEERLSDYEDNDVIDISDSDNENLNLKNKKQITSSEQHLSSSQLVGSTVNQKTQNLDKTTATKQNVEALEVQSDDRVNICDEAPQQLNSSGPILDDYMEEVIFSDDEEMSETEKAVGARANNCVVPNCPGGGQFFKVPEEMGYLWTWRGCLKLPNLKRDDPVCERHFHPSNVNVCSTGEKALKSFTLPCPDVKNGCCVQGCINANQNTDIMLHLPFWKIYCALSKWLELIQKTELRSLPYWELSRFRICERHFDPDHLKRNSYDGIQPTRNLPVPKSPDALIKEYCKKREQMLGSENFWAKFQPKYKVAQSKLHESDHFYSSCAFKGCSESSKSTVPYRIYFKIPSDDFEKAHKWLSFLERPDIIDKGKEAMIAFAKRSAGVCISHLGVDAIKQTSENILDKAVVNDGRKRTQNLISQCTSTFRFNIRTDKCMTLLEDNPKIVIVDAPVGVNLTVLQRKPVSVIINGR